jgi:saccharopine dehydrogenase (NAD+, L-lysine forming)
MLKIGLIREGKTPADSRVALIPDQCSFIQKNFPGVTVQVQSSKTRCYSDDEYRRAGIEVADSVEGCDVLLGIKEVPVEMLVPNKTYLFFSHTKKKQPHNQKLLRAILDHNITLIDYECLEHDDGTRIIGFGFFAGIVGAHNGMMCYGNRTGAYQMGRVYQQRDYRQLIHSYFGLKLPPIKIAVTGSGRVAHGILEVMNLLEVHEVEPEEYLETASFPYPVYVHLKGSDLYMNRYTGKYSRGEFHEKPDRYACKFLPFAEHTDILMNGVYWDKNVPRLFEAEHIQNPAFRIVTIADITDDTHGSVPINLGDQTIEDPVYGVDRATGQQTAAYLPGSVDVMAVGNLPNELPRDASRYFGEQLIKYVLEDLQHGGSAILNRATMVRSGQLNEPYSYLKEYAEGGE